MPSPVRRFMRAPLRAMAVGLLAVLLLASALLQDAASAALASSVDPTSRGIYDILVTTDDGTDAPALLPPNSLNTGEAQLSLEDVRALRGLAGVEVAAPIAQILLPNPGYRQLEIRIPVIQDQLVSAPESYRATVRLIGDDGLGERLLSEEVSALTIDRSNLPTVPLALDHQSCSLGDVEIPCALFPGWDSGMVTQRESVWMEALDGSFSLSGSGDEQNLSAHVSGTVSADQRVTLVDPAAESALLGAAGRFLEPLVALGGKQGTEFDAIGRWAAGKDSAAAQSITAMVQSEREWADTFRSGPAYAEYLRIKAERNEEPDPNVFGGGRGLMVPMIFPDAVGKQSLRAELALDSFGPTPAFPQRGSDDMAYAPPPPVLDAIRNGEPGTPLPLVSVDASSLLRAGFNGSVALLWPDTVPAETPTPTAPFNYPYMLDLGYSFSVHSAAPTDVVVAADGSHQLRLDGVGFRRLAIDSGSTFGNSMRPDTTPDPEAPDSDTLFGVVRDVQNGNSGQREYRGGIDVGGFGADEERAITELAAGIPLGAYESSDATLLIDGDGQSVAPAKKLASFGALGLTGSQTGAIADINNAAFPDENKVDAVRVRVAGVDAYDAAGIAAVTQTARAIEELGYRATIVAGSQGENVRVHVGNYVFGTVDAAEPQRVGELGVVEQRWSVLGPAAVAANGMSSGAQLMLATALAAVLGGFAIAELSGSATRRREAAVLRSLGWRRGRIVRWFAADYAVALPLLALAGLAALFLAAKPALTAMVVSVAFLAVAAVVIASLARATRAPLAQAASEAELYDVREFEYRPEARIVGEDQSPVESERPGKTVRMPRSPVFWGVQHAWRTPAASIPRALGVLAVMASVAAFSAASSEPGGGGPADWLLAACGVAAGLVLLLSLRLRETAAAPAAGPATDPVLAASGWLPRDIRVAGRAELLAAPLAAALLGSYALWFVLSSVGIDDINTAVSAALVAGLCTAALSLLPRRTTAPHASSSQSTPARKAALFRGIAS